MVWGLFPIDSLRGVQKYYIFAEGTYKVGRKDCDVIVQTDTSISRVHAEIIVDKMTSRDPSGGTDASFPSHVRLKDCSKYGTGVNREHGGEVVRLKKGQEVELKDGDSVTFGTGSATFRFLYVPIAIFLHSKSSSKCNPVLQARASAIGAYFTNKWSPQCTHVVVEESSSATIQIIQAVVEKKPIVRGDWLEVLAEKSICTEIPSFMPYVPTLALDGTLVKVVEPKFREKILEGYAFVMGSSAKYKFEDKLQLLLEEFGAKCMNADEFCSSSQASADEENHQFVLVLSAESANEFGHFRELSSLSRVTDMKLVAAILSGNLDSSIIEQPPYTVSSSHSTDETIVADSDVEMDTAASDHAASTSNPPVVIHDQDEDKVAKKSDFRDARAVLDIATLDNINPKNKTDGVMDGYEDNGAKGSDATGARSYNREKASSYYATGSDSVKLPCFKSEDVGIMNRSDRSNEALADRHENSDIIYSQDLIVKSTCRSNPLRSIVEEVNFKRFRKSETVSGNSFRNLVPFSRDPYKESDLGSNDTSQYMREEKKRKQMEAIAEDLFNNEKARKRATAGVSLINLLSRH